MCESQVSNTTLNLLSLKLHVKESAVNPYSEYLSKQKKQPIFLRLLSVYILCCSSNRICRFVQQHIQFCCIALSLLLCPSKAFCHMCDGRFFEGIDKLDIE